MARSNLPLRAALLLGATLMADRIAPAAATNDASLEAYVASLTTGSAYKEFFTGLPKYIPPDVAALAQNAPAVQSAETTLPPAQQSFLNSVISVEQVIEHTTVGPSEYASRIASESAAYLSVSAYLASVSTESAFRAIKTQVPREILAILPLLDNYAPMISAANGGSPDEVKSFLNSVISEEQKIQHTTVNTVIVVGGEYPFSSTTVTGGTFTWPPAMATATRGATSAPIATSKGVAASSSAGNAPTHAWGYHAVAAAGLALGLLAL